jgi:hypothetical protein
MAKQKRQTKVKVQVNALDQINPHAAGIDVGAEEVYVAVPPDRDSESVRSFPTFTADLRRLAGWLKACRVETVAMEATGVYTLPTMLPMVSTCLCCGRTRDWANPKDNAQLLFVYLHALDQGSNNCAAGRKIRLVQSIFDFSRKVFQTS